MQIAIPLTRNSLNHNFTNKDFNDSQAPVLHDNPIDSSASVSNPLDTANKILQQANLEHLNKRLPQIATTPTTAISKQTLEYFSPEKIGDRLVNFVSSALNHAKNKGATEKQLDYMMSQAKTGVNEGFAEAEEVLDRLGILEQEVTRNIESTYKHVQDGLNKLSVPDKPNQKKSQLTQINLAEYQEHYNKNTINMQIQTKEGDVIQLYINRTLASSESMEMAKNEESLFINHNNYNQERFQINYSLEGNLNNKEINALESFIGQVNDIAEDFFNRNIDAALNEAFLLEYDNSQLQSYSINMQSIETSRYTKIYQETSHLGKMDTPQPQLSPQNVNNPQQALRKLQQFSQQAQEQFSRSPITKYFPHPQKMGNELLQELIKSDDRYLRDFSSGNTFLERLLPAAIS